MSNIYVCIWFRTPPISVLSSLASTVSQSTHQNIQAVSHQSQTQVPKLQSVPGAQLVLQVKHFHPESRLPTPQKRTKTQIFNHILNFLGRAGSSRSTGGS